MSFPQADRSLSSNIRERRSPPGWETWINPVAKGHPSYKLQLCHEGMIDWAGRFLVSKNERYLLHIQKTGSGDNYGVVFLRRENGRFALAQPVAPSPSLSDRAWDYFRVKTGKVARCYHSGIEFVSWGFDGECLEISLHGTDVEQDYHVDEWKVHYNLRTRRFYNTPDQLHDNRAAIVMKHPETDR